MCGIAGVAGDGAGDVRMLERMAAEMLHRGPDGQGIWHDDRVGFAFRRLAIIDLHERSNQPLHFERWHLIFNGEIYNYLELRDELSSRGHSFVTEGDAEVLLHAWAEWGERALDRLDGMFAIAIWDELTASLTLAVDRFAEKPLFVHERPGRLTFASDIRALRAADPAIGIPSPVAADRFRALGTMPVLPDTFFADVRRLPASHLARWDGHRLGLHRWWSPAQLEVPSDSAEAGSQLRRLLAESVARRLRSDVPVGTSLSGGVDSSTVVALCSQAGPDQARHAFTATFADFERDEWNYAEVVARSAGLTEHHAVRPSLDGLLADLDALVRAQEEPFGSTSIYAQWCVMRCAREAGIRVLLDGQGADEMFGGYLATRGWALRALGPAVAVSNILHDHRLIESVAVAYTAQWLPRWVARRYRARDVSPYVWPESAIEAVRQEPPAPWWDADGSPLRREMLVQAFRSTLPELCRYADRDSMAFGVEVRLPFLDHRVAEFGLSAAAGLLYRGGLTKWLLRDAARGMVPDAVLGRRDKVGYETPEARWLSSSQARDRIAATVLDSRAQPAVLRREVERDLAAGRWRDPNAIWRALNVELWLSQWSRGAPLGRPSR